MGSSRRSDFGCELLAGSRQRQVKYKAMDEWLYHPQGKESGSVEMGRPARGVGEGRKIISI